MLLLDIAPIEAWTELERFIHETAGLNAAVFDHQGMRLSRYVNWANRLCPAIKAVPEGQTHICSCAHQVIAGMARKGRATVIEECDAGLLKFACPVFVGDDFLGVVGGCGLRLDGKAPDLFHVNKVTKIPLSDLDALATETPVISRQAAEDLARAVSLRVAALLAP